MFKVGARKRWLGWLPEQQFRRLHLIAGNTRYLVLPGFRAPNLATRVLGLSARRRRWAGWTSRHPGAADRLRSLCEFLWEVPEFRKQRGVRH